MEGKRERLNIEIVSTANPCNLDLSQRATGINSIMIDSFYSDGAAITSKTIGIAALGARGFFNEAMHENFCMKTIPAINGSFIYQPSESDMNAFHFNAGTTTSIGFISRDAGSLTAPSIAKPIVFTDNYILQLTIDVSIN